MYYNSGKKWVYPVLQSIMKEKNVSVRSVAVKMGMCLNTLLKKLYGKTEIKLWEAIAIRKALEIDMPLENLFEKGKILQK